jgi:DTW domain-containing protein YfiP
MRRIVQGMRLNALFKAMFMTRRDVAKRCSLCVQTVHHWCLGRAVPALENQKILVDLADENGQGRPMRELLAEMNVTKV